MAYVAADGSHILSDNGKHIALVETIVANRADFPPEEFRVKTDLGDGASIESTIPSAASLAADTFKADQAQRVKNFVASQASVEAERNSKQSRNDLVAQGKIIDTVILDAADTANSSNAALTILKNDEQRKNAPLADQTTFYQEI